MAALPLPQYLADEKNEIITERLLERIVGRMIDINYHLLTQATGLPPKDYHESFTRLALIGVLSDAFARSLASSAGLRNRIAHEYNGLDERLVHQAATAATRDVREYLRTVVAWAESQAKRPS